MDKQKTIKEKIAFEGIGLHTGEKTRIELLPAPAGSGIVFIRQDINGSPEAKACLSNVAEPDKFPRRTVIRCGDGFIQTIEHLMAALNILAIDNLRINVWGGEMPGLDGSAKDFVENIVKAGILEQDVSRNYITIKEPLWIADASGSLTILPADNLRVSYSLKYNHPFIGSGYMEAAIHGSTLPVDNFYQARTFCLEEEAKSLLDMGLGKGSNYDNTLVVSKTGVIKNKLRFPDEFTKHKFMDLLGDLYLIGPLKANVSAVKSGHALTVKLLKKVNEAYSRPAQTGVVLSGTTLNIEQIMKILPHRYPFLLVDRIIDIEKGKRAVGIKNVTMNEYFFQGHFPGRPIMPGVLMIEAMAQVGGIAILANEEYQGKFAFFMTVDKVKFRKTVVPGDQLRIEADVCKARGRTGMVMAKAYVADKVVVEGELMFALVD